MQMQSYRLPLGWIAAFPAEWEHEYDTDKDENIFYPADSDLTFRLTAFHAEKDGIPAPASVMETVFEQSVPDNSTVIDLPELTVPGCSLQIRGCNDQEDGQNVAHICAGCICEGDLLIFNIFGTDAQQVYEGLAYLTLIHRAV